MNIKEIYEYIDKIGCVSFSTIDDGYVQSRIAHFFAFDDEGLYFRTMTVKPFYHQLKKTGNVTVCGMYPSTQLLGHNDEGSPNFTAGYTLRITGDIKELTTEEVTLKGKTNPDFKTAIYDINKYPATRCFCIYKAKGEIFDYDFELEKRDHKLLRTRFSFGGMTYNNAGCTITDKCIGCGKCYKVCTFKAVEKGVPYKINGERCDECGSCYLACPVGAIEKPLTL
ncbi:4Fe-4S binding protein [Clostridium ganghwense]|uniref:Ferredoxin n=1 Tax=Clostridium ganghwense TaxID=312089 RepID=A0ABT4CQ91_9CLOT|nr:4Fe-4S binding protein [Clostridium ganghwense]MCY6371215.1 4Fe-4S binding protein [Clostridium ganghwense]